MVSFRPGQIRYWIYLAPKLSGQVASSACAAPDIESCFLVGAPVERSRSANPQADALGQDEGLTSAFSVHPEIVSSLGVLKRHSWFLPVLLSGPFFQV